MDSREFTAPEHRCRMVATPGRISHICGNWKPKRKPHGAARGANRSREKVLGKSSRWMAALAAHRWADSYDVLRLELRRYPLSEQCAGGLQFFETLARRGDV